MPSVPSAAPSSITMTCNAFKASVVGDETTASVGSVVELWLSIHNDCFLFFAEERVEVDESDRHLLRFLIFSSRRGIIATKFPQQVPIVDLLTFKGQGARTTTASMQEKVAVRKKKAGKTARAVEPVGKVKQDAACRTDDEPAATAVESVRKVKKPAALRADDQAGVTAVESVRKVKKSAALLTDDQAEASSVKSVRKVKKAAAPRIDDQSEASRAPTRTASESGLLNDAKTLPDSDCRSESAQDLACQARPTHISHSETVLDPDADPESTPESQQATTEELDTSAASMPISPETNKRHAVDSASSTPIQQAAVLQEDASALREQEFGRTLSERLGSACTSSTSRKRNKLKKITVNFSQSKHHILRDVVRNTVAELGWNSTEENDVEWHLMWTSTPVTERLCMKLRRPQRINHFPGMHHIAHKCELARTLDRVKQLLPEQFQFHPETFSLPVDRPAFERCLAAADSDAGKNFIVKPDGGACGHGIFLTRKAKAVPSTLSCVAQRYLDNPLLIDGRKFDLRLYVLVTSMGPVRAYLHHEGLARFASDKYQRVTAANIKDTFMHLTNYSLNKHHPDFQVVEQAEDEGGGGSEASADKAEGEEGAGQEAVGSKRSAAWVRSWLSANGFDVGAVWRAIEDLVVKTLLAAQPLVQQAYTSSIRAPRDSGGFSCFEVLGFDVMLDDNGTPWLIEVNEAPSWETSSPLDLQVKHAVLREALQMVCPTVKECRRLAPPRGFSPTRAVSLPAIPGAAAPPEREASPARRSPPRSPREQSDDAEVWAEVAALRGQQEQHYARGFRRIYPVTDPFDQDPFDTRPSSAASTPLNAQAAGWDFRGADDQEHVAERGEAYAACLRAAQEASCHSFWRQRGREKKAAEAAEAEQPEVQAGLRRAESGGKGKERVKPAKEAADTQAVVREAVVEPKEEKAAPKERRAIKAKGVKRGRSHKTDVDE